MNELMLEDLDERLRSRVLAATAHADIRVIRRVNGSCVVDARSGDRITHMVLSIRPDGSVAEATDSFLVSAVRRVEAHPGDATVDVEVVDQPGTVTLAAGVVETPAPDHDRREDTGHRDAFDRLVGGLDYPMFVVTASAGDTQDGCLVGFVTQASIDPPRMLVCLSDKNRTYRVAARADHLAVHFLGDHNDDLARLFGEETGDEVDKFARCSWRPGPGGAPIVEGTNGWVELRIVERYGLGDHVGFLGDVTAAECEAQRSALGFQRTRRLDAGHEP